jgi:hypothetical protein
MWSVQIAWRDALFQGCTSGGRTFHKNCILDKNRAEALKMGDVNRSLENLEGTSIFVKKSAGGKEPKSKKPKNQSKKSSWNM